MTGFLARAALVIGLAMGASAPAAQVAAVTYGERVTQPAAQAPWAVPLFADLGSGPEFFCTGVMVRPTIAVTAAHCLTAVRGRELFVKVSATTLRDGRLLPVDARWHHPDFRRTTLAADIGIVRLSRPARMHTYARLPAPWATARPGGFRLYGWGLDERGEVSGYLKSLAVDQETTSGRLVFAGIFDARTMISVGRWDVRRQIYAGACNGDSGGPLVRIQPGRSPLLIGVASFGTKGCVTRSPSVYTLVAPYYDDLMDEIDRLLR